MSIACDTARGLLYLHTAIPNKPLVHRDVKRFIITPSHCILLLLFMYPLVLTYCLMCLSEPSWVILV